MSYSCTLYKNTGFNATNIPDSINILNQCQHFSVPALDVMQERNLNTIKVKTTWDNVKDVDYCILGSWVYAVVDINMQATDVAALSVIPDYINSTGGVRALHILDGITERIHIADDSYGKYDEEDPLMTPAQPMQIRLQWLAPGRGTRTLIESTLDPVKTASSGKAKKYDTAQDSDAWVAVPQAVANSIFTNFRNVNASVDFDRGTALYNAVKVRESLAALRSLGLDQAIISQTQFPTSFVSITEQASGLIGRMVGKEGNFSASSLPFRMHNNIQNQRINYANCEKYGLITCAGETAEFEPASIYDGSTHPSVHYVGDPNPDGKPYFRYSHVNGDSSASGFFRNCLGGMNWKQTPLVFTGKSGSAIDTAKFENQSTIAGENYEMQQSMRGIQEASNVGNNIADLLKGNIGALLNQGTSLMNYGLDFTKNQVDYSHQRRSELLDYQISQNIVVPTVNFPYNSDIIRDAMGNGVLAFRYVYTDFDARRIDKLLTMYGYRYTKALETIDFVTRKHFNYVKAAAVSVGGHAAWINDGIAEQLKTGVRVWHVLPNNSYYTNNPAV